MTWNNNNLSFSHLSWWRNCHRAFNMSMSGEPGNMIKVVAEAAAFGNRSEKLWDTVFEENWFSLSDEEFELKLFDALSNMSPEDAVKLRTGFSKCFSALKDLIGTEYHLEAQKQLKVTTDPFMSYAKLDYFVISESRHLILDAKGSSARNKKYIEQLLHYAYLYWKLHEIIPTTYLFYSRLGCLDEHIFSENQLQRYGAYYENEVREIANKRSNAQDLSDPTILYKATPGDYCFVCAYSKDCRARAIHVAQKQKEREEKLLLRDDELFM